MKKKVNGKVVDIDIELFEKAFEGLALGNSSASSITDKASRNSDTVNRYIEEYENIYKCLPFPLYGIESDLKYAVIGNVMKNRQSIKESSIWVDNSLNIRVDEKNVLKFVGTTWSMTSVDGGNHRGLSIEEYENEVGYKEYKWVMENLINNKGLSEYYKKFMSKFIEACNNEPIVLKWELSKILSFGYVPSKMDMKSNRILDISNDSEYMIDIFSTGKKKTGESDYVINLYGDVSFTQKPKYRKTYNYEVFEKTLDADTETMGKFKKSDKEGFAGLFETLVGKGIVKEDVGNIPYEGIVVGNKIIYKVDGNIYICGFEKYSKPLEIGKNVDIYSVEGDLVYLVKNSKCESGVNKESIYTLNPKDMQIKLCRIQYGQ